MNEPKPIRTWPSAQILEGLHDRTPSDMYPNEVPLVVVLESILDEDECLKIEQLAFQLPPHKFPKCNAQTTEFPKPLDRILAPAVNFAREMNRVYFGFKVDDGDPYVWQQKYLPGDSYHLHNDNSAAQGRKFTAIVLLSDTNDYDGGALLFHMYPQELRAPRSRGTMIVFQSWLTHEVTPVTRGVRKSLNIGFYGPPFV